MLGAHEVVVVAVAVVATVVGAPLLVEPPLAVLTSSVR